MPGGGVRPADTRPGNSAEETAGGGWPFVDREGELDAVLAVVGGAAAASVVVAGPQGGGRTRLAQEVTRAAAAAGRRVEWVTCTRVTAAIPLGAIAQLVPAAGAATDLAAAWRAMVSTLAPDRENDRPTVVVFDDAHLLNDLCAALVHRLVLTRAASVVLTVSEAAPAPPPVDALWKDGLAARVDLAPLSRTHVQRILTATLGGLVESRTCQDLWRASGGNTLLLRELVEPAA